MVMHWLYIHVALVYLQQQQCKVHKPTQGAGSLDTAAEFVHAEAANDLMLQSIQGFRCIRRYLKAVQQIIHL